MQVRLPVEGVLAGDGPPRRGRRTWLVAEKPRLLVIDRESGAGPRSYQDLAGPFDVVVARSMARALALLHDGQFAGVYVDSAQLATVQWAGVLLQADEILDAIADGVAVVDPTL